MRRFEGKKAAVTGGGSGQGAAISLALAKEGADVAVLDLYPEKAQKIADELKEFNGKSLAMGLDVGNFKAVGDCMKIICGEFGSIDLLVNAAGYSPPTTLLADVTEELWDRCVNTHLKGVFNCCHHVIGDMVTRRYGRIVSISSVGALVGSNGMAPYDAAKAGVIGLTKALAKEVTTYGIFVNVIAPGLADTPFLEKTRTNHPGLLENFAKQLPAGRLGKPEDIAALCLFLLSDEAGYIVGQTINISGGWVM